MLELRVMIVHPAIFIPSGFGLSSFESTTTDTECDDLGYIGVALNETSVLVGRIRDIIVVACVLCLIIFAGISFVFSTHQKTHHNHHQIIMDELTNANTRLKLERSNHEEAYDEKIKELDEWEKDLVDGLADLNTKKEAAICLHGNPDATDDDLIEINAGGKVVVAK